MKALLSLAILALISCGANRSLIPAIAPVRVLPVAFFVAQQQQGNAASATKDNSATSGDQITKPAGAKDSTLIGCLSGPDKDGKYTLRSMNHRSGVEVLGPDSLKNDSGAKVKLTGKWEAPAQSAGSTEMRRFQVTDVEVMAKACSAPSETTPQSKNKKPKPTTYDAPTGDSSK
jgi:hypothetical protein